MILEIHIPSPVGFTFMTTFQLKKNLKIAHFLQYFRTLFMHWSDNSKKKTFATLYTIFEETQ